MRMAGIAGVLPINYLFERGFRVYPEKSIPVVSAKKCTFLVSLSQERHSGDTRTWVDNGGCFSYKVPAGIFHIVKAHSTLYLFRRIHRIRS